MLLLLHPEMPSPSRTQILGGFPRAMLAPFGVKVRLSYGHGGAIFLGAHFGNFGAVLEAIWDHFGLVAKALSKQPKDTHRKCSPQWPSRRSKEKNKSKNKISYKKLTCMAVQAKRNQKSTQNQASKRSPPWPCSFNLFRGRENPP